MHTITKTLFDPGHESAAASGVKLADIETAIKNFDVDYFKPPIHDGHPSQITQASHSRGYIKSVRLEDGKLVGELSVDDSVKADYDNGKLLGHSIELYKDFEGKGYAVRGLGLTGAMPPLQKGLEALFSETDDKGKYDVIIFAEPTKEKPPSGGPPMGKEYTDEQIAAIELKAATDARAEERAAIELEATGEETKEKLEALTKERDELKADKVKVAEDAAEAEIDRAIDTFAEKNKILPYKVQIMKSIAKDYAPVEGQDDVIVFSEGKQEVKMPLVDALGHLITSKVENSIKDDLTRPVTGAGDNDSGKDGKAIDHVNFAEHEANQENLKAVVVSFCEDPKNKDKSEGDAYLELAAQGKDAGAWIREAELK